MSKFYLNIAEILKLLHQENFYELFDEFADLKKIVESADAQLRKARVDKRGCSACLNKVRALRRQLAAEFGQIVELKSKDKPFIETLRQYISDLFQTGDRTIVLLYKQKGRLRRVEI